MEADKYALSMKVIAEMGAIDVALSELYRQHSPDAMNGIHQLELSKAALSHSLHEVQFAREAGALKQVSAQVEVTIRQSTEARVAPLHINECQEEKKKTAKALAVPAAGMVAYKFVGKTLNAFDYQAAVRQLVDQGKGFIDGFRHSVAAHAELAAKHAVDLMVSQQAQLGLIEQARGHYDFGKHGEAARAISEAAVLNLRDAEALRDRQRDESSEAMVQQARVRAAEAVRHTADQIQVDARRDCTTQGEKGQALEQCTVTKATQHIGELQEKMTQIQLGTHTPQDEAAQRVQDVFRRASGNDPGLLFQVLRGLSGVSHAPATPAKIVPADTPSVPGAAASPTAGWQRKRSDGS